MRYYFILFSLFVAFNFAFSQQSTSEKILGGNEGLILGGYGEVHGNFYLNEDNNRESNAKLDVHRLVSFIGYKFNDRVTFVSEIEYEHVVELYVEQAFLDYKINDNISFQSGLMLIPMGIQNLYHEPNTFNGVERTNVDKYIVPTTWREIGAGVSGRLNDYSVNYQLMIVNGFNGYDSDGGVFSGKSGLRSGRQKGAESYVTDFDFAGRVSYFGMLGWNLGASFYVGESETSDFGADSTQIDIQMTGVDARYNNGNFQARAQYIVANLGNTQAYNAKTSNDLGSVMTGYYLEAGYDVLQGNSDNKLILFSRYENYNTNDETEGFDANLAYDRTEITVGLTFKVADGAAFKMDYQLKGNEALDEDSKQVNVGIAVGF
ncbi:hypothetical protein N9H19_02510 [Flavobacteriales bacterium]|nr:hypothetical protein [Flavobacteriales bacterium]